MEKLLDLRFVIGVFFFIIGVLLLIHGFSATDLTGHVESVNKWCGGIFILFGVVMILLSFRGNAHDELLEED